jgi:lipopolysaccharide export system permease protein
MMKIADWYILRKFLVTFFGALGLILAIAVVFDVSEKIEDFVTKQAPLKSILLDYYVNFVVFYGNLFSSLIVFISTIFFASRMASNTEIVAMLTGGTSFRRLMYPFFLGALIVASMSYALNHYVIPSTNITRIEFERTYIKGSESQRFQDIHKQIKPGHYIYMERYTGERMSGYHFTYEIMEDEQLQKKLMADFIRYEPDRELWRLDNIRLREIDATGKQHVQLIRQMDTVLPFLPEEIAPRLYSFEMMTTPELTDFIEKEKLRGSENINFYLIEKYKRTSWPVSTFILILIAVSLSTKKSRGGIGLNLAIGLGICVIYIFFMQISTTLSTHGTLSAFWSVWIPNVLFCFLGIYLYRIAPK